MNTYWTEATYLIVNALFHLHQGFEEKVFDHLSIIILLHSFYVFPPQ